MNDYYTTLNPARPSPAQRLKSAWCPLIEEGNHKYMNKLLTVGHLVNFIIFLLIACVVIMIGNFIWSLGYQQAQIDEADAAMNHMHAIFHPVWMD